MTWVLSQISYIMFLSNVSDWKLTLNSQKRYLSGLEKIIFFSPLSVCVCVFIDHQVLSWDTYHIYNIQKYNLISTCFAIDICCYMSSKSLFHSVVKVFIKNCSWLEVNQTIWGDRLICSWLVLFIKANQLPIYQIIPYWSIQIN